jgi:hypothetical protein
MGGAHNIYYINGGIIMRVKQRLYLTEDGRVVNEHDPKGRRLLCDKGYDLPPDIVKKYGDQIEKITKNYEAKMVNQPENKGGLKIIPENKNQEDNKLSGITKIVSVKKRSERKE